MKSGRSLKHRLGRPVKKPNRAGEAFAVFCGYLTGALFVVFLASQGLTAPAPGQSVDVATLKGEFLSIVALPDNEVLLLSRNKELVKVLREGEIKTVSLPVLPEGAEGGNLKDFTIHGSTLTFCFFDRPLLLSIDLPKLDFWKSIELNGMTGKPQFARIEAWDDSFHLMAANGKWYSVDASGNVKELARNSLLLPDSARSSYVLQAESDPKAGLKTWKILRADGTEFLVRKSASKAEYLQTFLPVGFDSRDNFIFLEGTGPGQFKRSVALYAAKDGKIVASARIGKVGVPSFLKSQAVLSDGSVGFLAVGKEPKTLVLKKITLAAELPRCLAEPGARCVWVDWKGKLLVKADLSGATFTHADLTGADLSGANLAGAHMTGVRLVRANLTGATLTDAQLKRDVFSDSVVDLTGANLSGANLSGAYMPAIVLARANLTGANLANADLSRLWIHVKVVPGRKNGPKDRTYASDLSRANLTKANLFGVKFTNADLSRAKLVEANLTSADLTGANLTGADLTGAILNNATWTDGRQKCAEGSIGTCKK